MAPPRQGATDRTKIADVNRAYIDRNIMASASKYPERFMVTLEGGTLNRITGVLEKFDDRMHRVREAIEREIKRRQRQPRLR